MTLSEISIRRPVFAWMLMFGLILFGALSFREMGISQLPDVDFPIVSISVTYEGAAPEVMETSVVDVLEDAVMTVQGIRTVSSRSRYGNASITLEFDLNRDIDSALQEVQTKVAQAQRSLPRDLDAPVITKTNPEDQPILWLTVASQKHTKLELMRYTRDQLKDKFATVSGVGEVFLGGYVEPNLRVWVYNDKLNAFELSVTDVVDAIQNEHSELPAGQIETLRREADVRTLGEAKTPEEFQNLVIGSRGGRPNYAPTYLKQVARVEEGLAEVRRVSRFNGEPAVGLGIRKQRGSNAVAVARLVKEKAAELGKSLPPGMKIALNFDTTQFIEDSVGELNFTLILSALLTALVCWMFLGSWSSTLNVLLAIPTSIVGSFLILKFAGFTLNTFTLLGLSLAIGIVVDDAIMVLENIVRHRERGETRMNAALIGSREITFAAIAATIAIVAIFLPVAFMSGVIGKFFFQFGVTMTVTVLLSLLEALTLTPMRCSKCVEAAHRTTRFGKGVEALFSRTERGYSRTLTWALDHRWKVLTGSVAAFALSMVSVKFLNKEFVPAQDQSAFMVRMQTPPDSSLQHTDEKFLAAEKVFATHPEIERYFVAVGGFGGDRVNEGNAFITLRERHLRKVTQQQVMDMLRKELRDIGGVKVFIQDLSMRGFTASRGFPVEFTVRGPEWSKLAEYSEEIKKKLEAAGVVTDLDSDYQLGKPEVRVLPDRLAAARHGVSMRSISETIQIMIGGVTRGKYETGGHRYDVRIRLDAGERNLASQISKLHVRNNRGELVPLSQLVKLEEKPSLQQISRYDRERAISLFANVKPGSSQSKALAEAGRIAAEVLPPGYRVVFSGSAETFKQSFQDLVFALILGFIVAYMVLASQFNSFIDPVTVLLALPFSISGAFLALWIGGQSLNIYSFIGLILLMGIAKKNSILLVDFTNQTRDEGERDTRKALLKACPMRLRPILMTSLATVAGALPPALAIGPGAETRTPMAICVVGGVLVSTVLTLFVVPCAYSVFAGKRSRTPAPELAPAREAHA